MAATAADLVKQAVTVRTSWEDLLKSVVLFSAGAGATYVVMLATGHAPLWFGPERREWSAMYWNEDARRVLKELHAKDGFALHAPQSSDRNYLAADPDSARRVRRVLFVNAEERKGLGVVRFGADCEGPPRHVHGGCTAATMDQLMGSFVVNAFRSPFVTATLKIDYAEKIPLGSQLGFVIEVDDSSDTVSYTHLRAHET